MRNHRFSPHRHRFMGILIAAIAAVLIILGVISSSIVKWLWMRSLDYAGIFWTILFTQRALGVIVFFIAFLFVWINLRIVASKAGAGQTAARRVIAVLPSNGSLRALAFYVSTVVGLIFGLILKFSVQPNELEFETPYLKHNIDFTRKAFNLESIHEVKYPALSDLTQSEVAENGDTIRNVRLWDWRPLLQTYRQTQEIRLYYQFYDVDADPAPQIRL
jgi:uncharacterized membrane protein (UPF0182 family)